MSEDNTTQISVVEMTLHATREHPYILKPATVDSFGSSYTINCSKPISIQKGKHVYIQAGVLISTPQPVDRTKTNTIVAPYHMEWRVEPQMQLLRDRGIWAHGSSAGHIQAELNFVLVNFGDAIFNASAGDVVAILQFYLVPKLRIKGQSYE